MVTIQELAAGIIADARLQAERIDAQGREETQRIRAQTQELADAAHTRLEQEAAQQRKELMAKAEAHRQLVARQAVLTCKQELINETIAAAQKSIMTLPPTQRKALISRLLERAKRQMPIGTIRVAKQDRKYIKGFRTVPLEADGGFIAVSKDGNVIIDMRFATLLDHIKRSKTAEIADILFSETKERPAKAVKKPKKAARGKR